MAAKFPSSFSHPLHFSYLRFFAFAPRKWVFFIIIKRVSKCLFCLYIPEVISWNHYKESLWDLLRFGTYDAVAHFNIGRKSTVLIYELLEIIPGRYTTKQCDMLNRKRLFSSLYKTSDKARKRRKVLRGKEKSKKDKNEEAEGTIYESGAF